MKCLDCGATWTGHRGGHCKAPGCHQTFTSDSAADRHYRSRSGFAGCHDPATLTTKDGEPVFAWNERRQAWSLAGGLSPWKRPDDEEAR